MPPSFSYQLLPFSENNKKLKKQNYSLKSHHPPNHKLLPQSIVNHNDSRLLLNSGQTGPDFRILPFKKGKPLVGSSSEELKWHLGWLSLSECKAYFEGSDGRRFGEDDFVYLGGRSEDDDAMYWAIDVSKAGEAVTESGSRRLCFVELSTLMVATDLGDLKGMGELAIAGNARALLLWHNTARFCGYCGSKTVSAEAGRRKQCSSESCKKRIYPRVDSVVIMLVIDKDNDRVLLNKLSRFVPRMWSCLSGFIEPGESLEEAVRRETWEETGVEVGEVVYHSSQPWPIGAGSMPCQLMVGFFAYAKTLEINVDKEELEDAQWFSREDVRKALTFAEYKKAQLTAAAKVDKMCKGLEKGQNLSADFNVESRECAPMVIPGPSAIAHHLIASWVNQVSVNGVEVQKQAVSTGSLSNL